MTGSAPLVSVVIPAYNAERTLPAALQSVLGQTVQDFELIVVDDGSQDATAETAEAASDGRARILGQTNSGHAAARNTGLASAVGRYVAFLDADDIWLPDKLQRQLEWFEAHAGARALQTGVYRVDDDLNVLLELRCVESRDVLLDSLCLRNMPGLNSTLMVEKTALLEIGGYDASLLVIPDWDLAIRLALAGMGLNSIADPLAAYRYHATNQSKNLTIHIEPGVRILDKAFAHPNLPDRIRRRRRQVYARFYMMLCGGQLHSRNWRGAGYWASRAIFNDPRTAAYMLAMPLRRAKRTPSKSAPRLA